MRKAGLVLFVLALIPIWLAGCIFTSLSKDLDQRKQSTLLEDTLKTYGAAMRWSQFSALYGYIKVDEGKPEPVPKNLENVQITSYEVRHAPVMYDDVTAIQSADIEYVLKDRQAVKKLTDRQVWLYDTEKKIWQLISKIPDFN